MVHWRAFKHNKEADNALYESLTANVLQWRSFNDNEEEDNNL